MLPEIEKFGVNVCYDAREAVNNADVILTTRMRMESLDKFLLPSLDEYKRFFRIDENLLKYAKKDVWKLSREILQKSSARMEILKKYKK